MNEDMSIADKILADPEVQRKLANPLANSNAILGYYIFKEIFGKEEENIQEIRDLKDDNA